MRLRGREGCFSLTRGWVLPNVGTSPPGPLSKKERGSLTTTKQLSNQIIIGCRLLRRGSPSPFRRGGRGVRRHVRKVMTALPYSYKSPLLTLDHVSMRYGNDLILRDLNAQVLDVIRPGLSQGQVVGIYGRSGIGKSVLCRLLAGLAAPSAGTVL
ncbi:MAG: ATP-binding cassette domain-containing protein, partial [Hymenobacter sp.]